MVTHPSANCGLWLLNFSDWCFQLGIAVATNRRNVLLKKIRQIVIKCYSGLLVVRPGPVPLEIFLIPLGRRQSWVFRSSVCQSLEKMQCFGFIFIESGSGQTSESGSGIKYCTIIFVKYRYAKLSKEVNGLMRFLNHITLMLK